MGAAAKYRKKFMQEHPYCAFCGGGEAAVTIEHCPPRSLFQNREWPEGFEFPSCEACNSGTSNHDVLIAMIARVDPIHLKGNLDGKHEGLMKMVNRQYPGLLQKMMPSATEARKANRKLGIQPAYGQTHQEVGVVKIPEEVHEAVCIFAKKLSKGIFYKETRSIFPNNGCLLMNWFTNAELIRTGKYGIFEILKNINGEAPLLKRGGKFLNNQFEYKLSLAPEKTIFALQAKLGNSFGFVVFGSVLPGLLEKHVVNIREQSQHNGPFAILQSPTLQS